MDGVDFRILAALHVDALQSHAALGRRVGLSAPAVAKRLGKLSRNGVLAGFRANIHPRVFGKTSYLLVFDGPYEEEVVKATLEQDNVVWVAWKLDGGLTVQTFGTANLPNLGAPVDSHRGDSLLPPDMPTLMVRVLAQILKSPRASRDELALATGLCPKTCAKHRDVAIKQGLMSIQPVLGALIGTGVLTYHVAVFGDEAQAKIGALLQQAVLVNESPGVQYWFCMAPDYATALLRQDAVRRLGLEIRPTMNRAFFQNDVRLQDWLANLFSHV